MQNQSFGIVNGKFYDLDEIFDLDMFLDDGEPEQNISDSKINKEEYTPKAWPDPFLSPELFKVEYDLD